jgi:iron complex outermembrane receptor protein
LRHSLLTRRHRAILLATIALAVPGQLLAQDGAPTVLEQIEVESESDDILVQDGYVAKSDRIGTKTDTPLVEIPQSISAVTQDQIEDQKPRSLNEALTYTAGANVGTFGYDTRYDAFFLRGFPAYYTGTFRDSLRQFNAPSGFFKIEPYGIEGITVLKGPSSALYGNSGPGGIVNIMTKRPKDELFREVEVLVGNQDRYQLNMDASGPASEDGSLLYRMTGVVRQSNTHLPGFPDDKVYLAPALTFKPDEDTRLTILGEYSKIGTGGTAAFYNSAPGVVTRRAEADPDFNAFDQNQGRIGYEFEHRLNDTFTIRQNARFASVDADLEYSGWYATGVPSSRFARYWGHYAEDVTSAVIDNQIQAEFDTGPVEHVAIAGLDYGYSDYTVFGPGLVYAFPTDGLPLKKTAAQEMNQLGVYLHDQAKWNNFTLFATGRYDWVDTNSATAAAGGGFTTTDQKDEGFSKRIGLSYRTDWGLIPYATYSTSFSPNIGVVYDNVTNALRVAQPTEATQREVGVKYEMAELNATVGASVFDIKQENGVVFDATTGINQQRQVDLRSRGFEIEGSMTLDNGLGLVASYTHLKMEILRGVPGTEGNELSGTPNDVFALWAHYLFEDDAMAGVGVGAGVRYSGGSFGDDANTFKNASRVFVDASVSYDFGYRNPDLQGLSLQVNAKNLFDERKSICSAGYCYWDEGRSVIGSLRYRF